MPSHPLPQVQIVEVGVEVVLEEAGPPEAAEEEAGAGAGESVLFFSPLIASSPRVDLMPYAMIGGGKAELQMALPFYCIFPPAIIDSQIILLLITCGTIHRWLAQ
jgi:hypothetical protein